MISRLLSLFNVGMRAYKVQDGKRETRVGIVAGTFEDFLRKGCDKLQMSPDEVTVVLEDDGTIVEDNTFFKKLPPQTVFVFLQKGETWQGSGNLILKALNRMYDTNKHNEIAAEIRKLLTDEDAPEKINVMSKYLDILETDTEAEERYENEDWFEGLNEKYQTKSEVMKNIAQTRIRSYYKNAREQIEKGSFGKQRKELLEVMELLMKQLRKNAFHGNMFVRGVSAKERLCDKNGWFTCQGPFDSDKCDKFHTINPYASKGYRHLFSLWNLDHIIEKSRVVVPCLIEATQKKKSGQLNWQYAYKLLFTTQNLKLVHTECHMKTARPSTHCSWKDFCI